MLTFANPSEVRSLFAGVLCNMDDQNTASLTCLCSARLITSRIEVSFLRLKSFAVGSAAAPRMRSDSRRAPPLPPRAYTRSRKASSKVKCRQSATRSACVTSLCTMFISSLMLVAASSRNAVNPLRSARVFLDSFAGGGSR